MIATAETPEPSFRSLKEKIAREEIVFPARVEKVARLCFEQPEVFAFGSAVSVARRAGVSSSTVARFVAVMGFSDIKTARKVFQEEVRLRTQTWRTLLLKRKAGDQSS